MFKFFGIFGLLIITSSFVLGTDPKVPCHYIFGDSLFDAGNNNNLMTTAKANYKPYGVDFPGGVATGRFTNGLTTADRLTQLMGLQDLIKPFATASGSESVKGVNYGSGVAGIRDETGSQSGDRIPFSEQVKNHGRTIVKLPPYVTGPVSDYLKKCLYTVDIGSNDYIFNYFMPEFYTSKSQFTPDQYATALVDEYEKQLKILYIYGARQTAVFGLGQVGCIPAEIQMNKATQCVDEINQAVKLFNGKLVQLVDNLNARLSRANFTYIDMYALDSAFPKPPGFNDSDTCCKVGANFLCLENVPPCPDRTQYRYYDGYHPTEVRNKYTAQNAYISPNSVFVHPVDIYTLVSS